jgi:hypothetical protein
MQGRRADGAEEKLPGLVNRIGKPSPTGSVRSIFTIAFDPGLAIKSGPRELKKHGRDA